MPDKPAQDKTEKATPHRRRREKEEGNVCRSMELNSVVVLFAGIFALKFFWSGISDHLLNFVSSVYIDIANTSITSVSIPVQARTIMVRLCLILLPVFVLVMIAGIGVNYAQVGFVNAKKALVPKLSRLNPIEGLKRLFSLRSLVELIKGIIKILIVSFIAYSVLKKYIDECWVLYNSTGWQIVAFLGKGLFELAIKIGLALLIFAIADYSYQKWEYEKRIKMTKQEVKDEYRQYEGSPEVKSRIHLVQRQIARRRMMAAVPEATAVVTNPVFIAVALKYKPVKKSDAPIVVAKGKRKIAEKIKEIAMKNDVPVVENKPLARSLYENTEIGMEIPIMYYQAVAEILVHIYQMEKEGNASA